MNAKVITNTKLALILYRFNLDKFEPIWKQKAKVVCKHTQRMRIMWERICQNEATLPLFDEDYTFDNPLELFKPVDGSDLPQSLSVKLSSVRAKRDKLPSLEELKELFWAEELRNPPRQRRKQ
ncbi:hypothetical protein [Campylobacter lanienae]|uniref:hypothetical protein n=1 Tax=Campylobacter lanienae TaxID=75658 RepID=UPI000BB4265B|nr:hypothetical protein [Campylobacter lanienae]